MSNFVEVFAKEKEKLKQIAQDLRNEEYLTDEDLIKIEETLNNKKIQIAIIGQMKYGKSTFINSLIFNKEFLPSSSTPMTAALSKIEYGEKEEYKVTFFTKEEFEEMQKVEDKTFQESIQKAKKLGAELDKLLGKEDYNISPSEFEDYVGAEGRYTSIVKMLTIKTPNEILKEAVVVDTPGFNDPVKSRDEIAFNFISKADFIILFLYAGQPFNRTDKNIVVDKFQEAPVGKLIVTINKSDVLLEEHGSFDRVKKYVEEKYKTSIQEGIASKELKKILLSADIIPISSLMALLGKMDMDEIQKDENLKWYFDKYKKEVGFKNQEDLLDKSNIKTLENIIKKTIEEKKGEILINKVKGEILKPIKDILSALEIEKLSIEQDLNNLENFDDIEEKKELINNFIDNEFDEITSTYEVYKEVIKISDECKKTQKVKVDDFENKVLKRIGILIDSKGREKGVETLKSNFRQFNVEIKQAVRRCLEEDIEILKEKIENIMNEMFMTLKRHRLGAKFKIKSGDFDRLKENILSSQLDSISKLLEDITLSFPIVDTGFLGDSEIAIKEKFYKFVDDYFKDLRNRLEATFNEFNSIIRYRVGSESEIKKELRNKLITPLEESLSRISNKDKEERDRQEKELKSKLEEINQNIEKIAQKFQEVENKIGE